MKADIYFDGKIIQTVEFDKMFSEPNDSSVSLVDMKSGLTVAVVPKSHLIIVRPLYVSFEIKGSDLNGVICKDPDASRI